jgi:type II secretory pathway component PulF
MILTYDAVDSTGQSSRDTIDATDPREAVDQLRRRGLYVTRIEEVAERKGAVTARTRPSRSARLPLKTLVLFTRQMAMLLRAGSGLVPAIMAIKRQMRKPGHAAVLGDLVGALEDGARLTEALRRHPDTFDPVYCAIVAAGEASASLTEMFERLAIIVGKRRSVRNRILGALAYPALLVVMCCAILLTMLLFVLPRFSAMFTQLHVETPLATRVLLATGDWIASYWPVVLGLFVALGFLIVWLTVNARGRQWLADVQILIPLAGRIRLQLIQAQIFRTMGTLLESSVGVLDTLELARASTQNRRFQELFDRLDRTITSGGELSSVFGQTDLVEAHVCQAIHTGEDSGNLGGALTYCADILDETNGELIDTSMRLIEPVILMGMGLVVGAVAISLFLPLFEMTSAMR